MYSKSGTVHSTSRLGEHYQLFPSQIPGANPVEIKQIFQT